MSPFVTFKDPIRGAMWSIRTQALTSRNCVPSTSFTDSSRAVPLMCSGRGNRALGLALVPRLASIVSALRFHESPGLSGLAGPKVASVVALPSLCSGSTKPSPSAACGPTAAPLTEKYFFLPSARAVTTVPADSRGRHQVTGRRRATGQVMGTSCASAVSRRRPVGGFAQLEPAR